MLWMTCAQVASKAQLCCACHDLSSFFPLRSVDGAKFRNLGILVTPSWKQRVRDAQLVQRSGDPLINNVLQGLGLVIKGRHGRLDRRPIIRCPRHEFQMTFMQRCFPHHED